MATNSAGSTCSPAVVIGGTREYDDDSCFVADDGLPAGGGGARLTALGEVVELPLPLAESRGSRYARHLIRRRR